MSIPDQDLSARDVAQIKATYNAIRSAAIEEVAQFVETHYCVIDWDRGPQHYKVESRTKHPLEPLAMAIRGLK